MNKESDRPALRRSRFITLIAAAAILAAALWSSGAPSLWVSLLLDRSKEPLGNAPLHESPSTAKQMVGDVPSAVVAGQALPGTDSSVSPVPGLLLLISTIPGRNPNDGTARLGTDAQNPQTYSAGAILANRARLAEIHADHVVLERDGQRLRLYLAGKGPEARVESDLATVGARRRSRGRRTSPKIDWVDVIRYMPYYDGDLFAGLQIFPGQRSGVFAQLGLKSGDVIVAIDSVPLADHAAAAEMLRTLTDGATFTVSIRRAGAHTEIGLDGAIIAAAQSAAAVHEPLPPALPY